MTTAENQSADFAKGDTLRFKLKRIYLAVLVLLLTCTGAFANNTAGPNNPTVASGSGWTTPSGIESTSTVAHVSVLAGGNSSFLVGSAFGFAIPTGSTINGIVVSFDREEVLGSGQLETGTVSVTKTVGVQAGNRKIGSAPWTTSFVTETYGASNDLWGTTWTVADINGTGFGFFIDVIETSASYNRTAGVQNYTITVTYTLPAVASGIALFVGWPATSQTQGIIVGSKRERGATR